MDWKAVLKQMKLDHIKRTAPGFFEASGGHSMDVKSYSDKTANGLTNAIIDYINMNQAAPGSANRISTTGTMRKVKSGEKRWTNGTTRKGTADIHAVIAGRHCSIEVKVGRDKQSESQMKEQERIEKAGGLYFIARDMPEFIKWYSEHFEPAKVKTMNSFTEEVLLVQMNPATYALANKLIRKGMHNGKQEELLIANTPERLKDKLHQIYTGTVILDNEERRSVTFDSSKIDFIMDHFRGQKIAIYYVYKAEKVMITWHVGKYGLKLTEDPAEFNNTDSGTVFYSQIRAGREGINLSAADAIVLINIEFSYVSYAQVRARLQLKDRTKPAKVFWVFSAGGIEHKIYERVVNKQEYTNQHFKKDFEVKQIKGEAA